MEERRSTARKEDFTEEVTQVDLRGMQEFSRRTWFR